jgi:uncharacterized protein
MQTTIRGEGKLSQFMGRKYLRLETYRGNGEPVSTPVWFVTDDSLVYVLTDGQSGKAKRIRRNPRVRIVATTSRGKPDGEWIEGKASITESPELGRIKRIMDAKYGVMDKAVAQLYKWVTRRRTANAVISIRV